MPVTLRSIRVPFGSFVKVNSCWILLLLSGLLAAALLLAGLLTRVLILLTRIRVLVGHRDLPCWT